MEIRPKKSFWQTKTLKEMNQEEWESLCDRCGKCCLVKMLDNKSNEVFYTRVLCNHFETTDCSCKVYQNRIKEFSYCTLVTPDNIADMKWMPDTCAYSLIAEGKDLKWWHPLVSGDPETVHVAGISVRDRKTLPAEHVHPDELLRYVVWW
jgi:uncharacterized protein